VQLDRAHDPVRDRIRGVNGAVGVLEDHRHLAAVRQFRLAAPDVVDLLAVEANNSRARSVDHREQSSNGALAAPALAHQCDYLAPADRETHVVDGVQQLLRPEAPHPESARQTGHFE
jgi:tetrahydromethanopterin S-methyltransferase subunit A